MPIISMLCFDPRFADKKSLSPSVPSVAGPIIIPRWSCGYLRAALQVWICGGGLKSVGAVVMPGQRDKHSRIPR